MLFSRRNTQEEESPNDHLRRSLKFFSWFLGRYRYGQHRGGMRSSPRNAKGAESLKTPRHQALETLELISQRRAARAPGNHSKFARLNRVAIRDLRKEERNCWLKLRKMAWRFGRPAGISPTLRPRWQLSDQLFQKKGNGKGKPRLLFQYFR